MDRTTVITEAMVLAGARAMYSHTKTAQVIVWDLLPKVVQHDLLTMSLSALTAARDAAPMPES